MDKGTEAGAQQGSRGEGARRPKWKSIALAVMISTAAFVVTGCYHDPYYGRGRVHTGVYASYGTPVYGHGYYGSPYGYGYAPGYVRPTYGHAAIGISTVRTRRHYAPRSRYYRGTRSAYVRGTQVRRGTADYRRGGREFRRGDRRGAARRAAARQARAQVQPE
jgi:hypothetical protein